MRALDLFCGGGGSTKGLQKAGFHVVGVDINPQPHYCGDSFIQSDALLLDARKVARSYNFVWASPPCQRYSRAQRLRSNIHPDLIAGVRRWLESTGLPWVIENVLDAPLINPVQLCGTMFGLQTYRHRLFEASFPLEAPPHPKHEFPLRKMGRPVRDGEFMHIVGNFSGVERARKIMGCDWMVRDELREAIPPAYSEYIARQFLANRAEEASSTREEAVL